MSKQCVVSELFVHPIKGCRPTAVDEVEIDEFGVKGDREYMVIRGEKKVNLKNLPGLAKIGIEQIAPGHIRLLADDAPYLEHQKVTTGASSSVTFILDNVDVIDQGDEVANWISNVVGEPVRLVTTTNSFKRNFPIDALKSAHNRLQKGFKDVSPVMVINGATFDDLNSKLSESVPVQRFRPNIVVRGLEAFDEDKGGNFTHAQVEFSHVSPCERCVIVNTDHEQGVVNGKDPLNTLSKYRRIEDKYDSGIVFGNYFNIEGNGLVKIGDELVLSWTAS